MDNVGRVNVKAASQELIHEILAMVVCQILARVNDSMHISFHKICNDVNIFITNLRWRLLDINKTNDIFVIKEFYERKLE